MHLEPCSSCGNLFDADGGYSVCRSCRMSDVDPCWDLYKPDYDNGPDDPNSEKYWDFWE